MGSMWSLTEFITKKSWDFGSSTNFAYSSILCVHSLISSKSSRSINANIVLLWYLYFTSLFLYFKGFALISTCSALDLCVSCPVAEPTFDYSVVTVLLFLILFSFGLLLEIPLFCLKLFPLLLFSLMAFMHSSLLSDRVQNFHQIWIPIQLQRLTWVSRLCPSGTFFSITQPLGCLLPEM